MWDTARVAFLVITDAVVVALLIMLLSGCVATPSRYRDRNGDFIMNIGSTDKVSPAPAAMAGGTVPSAPSVGLEVRMQTNRAASQQWAAKRLLDPQRISTTSTTS